MGVFHRGAPAAQPKASGRQGPLHRTSSRLSRQNCFVSLNIASSSRPTSSSPAALLPISSQSSQSSSPSKHGKIMISTPNLPTVLAGVSGCVLLAAAALHQDSASSFTSVDVIGPGLGPNSPLWSALLSHPHASSATGQAASTFNVPSAAAGAVQGARHIAEGAVSTVRGAVDQTCDGYNRWLEESPLMCKIVTGNVFTIAGDMLAQLALGGAGGHGDIGDAGAAKGRARKYDFMRTTRLCLETSAFGTPAGHYWFGFLDSTVMPDDPHCPTAVLTKMLADQLIFAPLGLVVFFAIIKCLEGRPKDISKTLRTSYWKALLGGYLLWPAAGILNFALLPNEYRLLFNNCVNILWTCFLSIMSSGDVADDHATTPAPNTKGTTAATVPISHHQDAATTSPALTQPPTSPRSSHAAAPSFASGLAQDLAVAAVTAAAISTAVAAGRPTFGCVAGIAVAVIEAALMPSQGHLQGATSQPSLSQSSPPPFAGGAQSFEAFGPVVGTA